jgi:hypothetical protein
VTRLAPLWQQAGSYPASTDRVLISTIWPTAAVTGGAVTAVANSMQLSIAAGTAAVPLGSGGASYSALCRWDAAEVVTLSASPPSGQSRIDLIVLQVRDNALDGGGNNDFIFQGNAGTPTTGTPVAPAVPPNAIPIAQITIVGGSANLNSAVITDRRLMANPASLYSARAYRQAAFVPTATAPIVLDTASFDPSGGFTLTTGLYTCPAAGVYMVAGALSVSATAASQILVGTIQRNGVTVTSGGLANSTAATQILTSALSDLVNCARGDTLAVANGYNPFNLNGTIGPAFTYLAVQYLHA